MCHFHITKSLQITICVLNILLRFVLQSSSCLFFHYFKCFQQCLISENSETLFKVLCFMLLPDAGEVTPIRGWGRKWANVTKHNRNKILVLYLICEHFSLSQSERDFHLLWWLIFNHINKSHYPIPHKNNIRQSILFSLFNRETSNDGNYMLCVFG